MVDTVKATICKCGHSLAEHKGIGACLHGHTWPMTGRSVLERCHCHRFRKGN